MAEITSLTVDGSLMEGGGQILRNSVTLSCLTKQQVSIYNIRGNRSRPGLRPQHLHGLRLVCELCNGELNGDKADSMKINFNPKQICAGAYNANTKTAGSVCLLMQISIPCLSYADEPSIVTFKGGTNADMAPPVDYYMKVFKPIASQFGLNFNCELICRGFYPQGGGEVRVTVNPCSVLNPVDLTDFGRVVKIYGTSYVAGTVPIKVGYRMADAAKNYISSKASIDVNIDVIKEERDKAVGSGYGIILIAETTTGCLLSGSCIRKKGKPAEDVGQEAAVILMTDINYKSCVDTHLQDQLILLMALAKGVSKIKTSPMTMHTETAIYIAETFTKAKFTVHQKDDGGCVIECQGCGHTSK